MWYFIGIIWKKVSTPHLHSICMCIWTIATTFMPALIWLKCVYAYASPRARASQVSRVLSSGHSDNRSSGRAAAILVSAVRPTAGNLGALQRVSLLRHSPLAEEPNPPWEEGNWSASHTPASHTPAGDLKF